MRNLKGFTPWRRQKKRKKVKIQRKSTEQGALTLWRPQNKGKGQDMKENPPSKGHSLSGEQRGRDKSGHAKTMTEWGALTLWIPQREGQVKIWEESNQTRGTHKLEITEGGTSQDTERKQPNKGHSLPGDHRERDKSGHRKKATKQGALTNWRSQREGQVRTQKESNQTRGTQDRKSVV